MTRKATTNVKQQKTDKEQTDIIKDKDTKRIKEEGKKQAK